MQDNNFLSAVREGNPDDIAKFFQIDGFDPNILDDYNESALIIAVGAKNKELVRLLLSKGVNKHTQGHLTGTALTFAIFMQETEITRLLLEAEETFSDQKHPTALMWAVQNQDKESIRLILKKGGDINLPGLVYYDEKDSPEWVWKPMPEPTSSPFHPEYLRQLRYTPLVFALHYYEEDFVKFLLEECGADVNRSNPDRLDLAELARSKEKFSSELILQLSKTTTQTISPRLLFFKSEQTIVPNMLLEPFKECFEFAYMEITETISATDKNLFLNILQEGKLNCCQLVELSRKILIPETLISSICLCYCGLHPDKWDEFPGNLSDIKRNLLDNTVIFSLPLSPSEGEKEKCLSYLKKTAQAVCKEHFNDDIKLSPRHEDIKQSLITECTRVQQPVKQDHASALIGGSLDLDKSLLKGYLQAYSEELSNINKQAILTSGDLHPMIRSELTTEINTRTKTSQLISSLNPEWKAIYDLVKFPPKYSRMRNERRMLGVIKAILYKIETNCSWSSIPQNFEEGGCAYYYYRTFQRENVLNKVLSIASKISTQEQEVERKLE